MRQMRCKTDGSHQKLGPGTAYSPCHILGTPIGGEGSTPSLQPGEPLPRHGIGQPGFEKKPVPLQLFEEQGLLKFPRREMIQLVSGSCKGQLISKCHFEKIIWTKIPRKNLINSAHYTCWAESIKFCVGILVQTIFSKRHFEICNLLSVYFMRYKLFTESDNKF